ncbi:MAG TPA: ABC-2 family transporter protein [Acidimicrobiia bacterium]|jgi:ABC-2 type transport system permease protein
MIAYTRMYAGWARVAILEQFQYRVANYFYMIGMVAEPVIYLVVWSTVAEQRGGAVGGFTAGDLAAYYIVWTLVRNMNIVLTPYAWEQRIKEGELVTDLLRPVHPVHRDLAYFGGWKLVVIVMWLPIAAVLTWIFRPSLDPSAAEIGLFAVALWGGFFVRFFALWALGLVTLWTTRVSALFELYFTAELLLSGRLVPLSLMPTWVQTLADFLPFQWAFQFPIETLIGRRSTAEIWLGIGMQALWTCVAIGVTAVLWRRGTRRFAAVGG